MRRRLFFAALALPLAGAAISYGCSDEPAVESLCGWISDPGNCFRWFREDMKSDGGTDCKPAGNPTPVDPGNDAGTPNGAFLKREGLDVCVLTEGGSVTIDPPIDLTMWPPDPFALPTTYKFTFKTGAGVECGSATYTSPHGFSITVNPGPDAGASDAGISALIDAGDAGVHYYSGTYTEVSTPGRDTIDTTCPSGEAHHFVLDEANGPAGLDGGAVSACPGFQDLVPRAILAVDPGGIDQAGAVSLSIVYPPINKAYPSNADPQNVAPVKGDVVTYFNCTVAEAPETCADGVLNSTETDIDCGGPQIASQKFDVCPARCDIGQLCNCDSDCISGQVCAVDAMDGAKKCAMTGTSHPKCSYDLPDAGTDAGDGG